MMLEVTLSFRGFNTVIPSVVEESHKETWMSTNLYIICDKDLILSENNEIPQVSDLELFQKSCQWTEYFEEKALNLQVLGLKNKENLPAGYKAVMLREFSTFAPEETTFLAFRAAGLLNWRRNSVYCGVCGAKLTDHKTLTARECPDCKNVIFPRISPCIIVTVQKEGKILLARHTYRNQDIFACIAGFMETGESAEHAVAREVLEETGLKIKNITYRGSQSWPFPDQLMLGFTADYESGEFKLQESEIAEAQWFDPENCPASPKPGSIAYKLIHKLY